MNKVRMHTLSGSVYAIDMENLTWERVGRLSILGMPEDRSSGRLAYKPTLLIGGRAILVDTIVGAIATTPVVLLEDISTEVTVLA